MNYAFGQSECIKKINNKTKWKQSKTLIYTNLEVIIKNNKTSLM